LAKSSARKEGRSCDIAARMRKAVDKAKGDEIGANRHFGLR
jgi:hypothetical protein